MPQSTRTVPVVISPPSARPALSTWVREHRHVIDEGLADVGALLLRGFTVSRSDFEDLCETVSGKFVDYEYRSNNRTKLTEKLFNSTEYPASERIPFHNEMSYFSRWPRHVWFLCEVPAAAGGDTPLADSTQMYQQLPPDLREPFERLGVRYTRTIGPEVDLSWRDVFQTEDRRDVDAYCARFGIDCEWLDDEQVRTSQHRPGVIRHPATGELVWFNQAHLFHPSALGPELHAWLVKRYGEERLPRNAQYGDGSPIPVEVLDIIRATYQSLSCPTLWEQDDVLVFDNIRYAHARDSFTPPRRIVVGLTGSMGDEDLPPATTGEGDG
jgi:alpha-ketoglutarate-dependent taurine dioxygenase